MQHRFAIIAFNNNISAIFHQPLDDNTVTLKLTLLHKLAYIMMQLDELERIGMKKKILSTFAIVESSKYWRHMQILVPIFVMAISPDRNGGHTRNFVFIADFREHMLPCYTSSYGLSGSHFFCLFQDISTASL